jgi:hypothetical protein
VCQARHFAAILGFGADLERDRRRVGLETVDAHPPARLGKERCLLLLLRLDGQCGRDGHPDDEGDGAET